MNVSRIEDYRDGWVVGNFTPSVIKSDRFEIAVKYFAVGDTEPLHFQLVATEVTVVTHGECRIGNEFFSAGDVIEIPPLEAADFEALTDCTLIAIKSPSIPSDKVFGTPG